MNSEKFNGLNIAHIAGDGRVQTLEEHLTGTAELCERFTNTIGIEGAGQVMGLLHDLGKATEDFCRYITDEESGIRRGELDHSTAGAQYLFKREAKRSSENVDSIRASEMMELAIASHHSGLINCVSEDGVNVYSERVSKDEAKTRYSEATSRIDESILSRVDELMPVAISSLSAKYEEIASRSTAVKDRGSFRVGLLERYLLSCLIDADRIDTISFQEGRTYRPPETDWPMLRDRFEGFVSSLPTEGRISEIRRGVSEDCLTASHGPRGLYTLSVPTGGGKTFSSFRFAINHLCEHGMRRIIYVVPYLSIIEQNADAIRKALDLDPNDDYVTECHSNVDVGEDRAEPGEEWSSPMDSWDRPVIFTSLVQFLETLFSSGTRRIRRMHNLADSVIVFDEVQSLPIKTVHMFNEAVSFLTKHCGVTAVLCTATQPLLGGELDYRLEIDGESEIIRDVEGLFNSLDRTRITYVNKDGPPYDENALSSLILKSVSEVDSILTIVNTKSMARKVYSLVKASAPGDVSVYHLSTNMCPAHRRAVLGEVRKSLGRERIVCISTQLIEAGVDIDFERVFRSMAGLDSIAQAAGRCNRNALRERGEVLVVKTNENIGSLVDIDIGRDNAEPILRRFEGNPTAPEAIRQYYDRYFFDRRHDMAYLRDNPDASMFDLLSSNQSSVHAYKRRFGASPKVFMRQAFADANREFRVIDETECVIVPYDNDARSAIDRYVESRSSSERRRTMRELQQYSVSIRSLDRMKRDGVVACIDEDNGIYCLNSDYYSEETGIVESPSLKTIMM